MPSPLSKSDFCYISLFVFFITQVYLTQDQYEDCSAPIQVFLIGTYLAAIVQIIALSYMLDAATLQSACKLCLTFISFIILCPVFFYLTIQGAIWQIDNQTNTPDCEPMASWVFWLWIVALSLVDLVYVIIFATLIYSMKKACEEETRMQRIRNQIGSLEGADLDAYLMALNPDEEQLANELGLSEYQISHLPRKSYAPGIMSFISHQNACPICLADFQQGEEVVQLPRCGHTFDPDCVSDWLRKSPLCPMCRTNVRDNLYTGEYSTSVEDMA